MKTLFGALQSVKNDSKMRETKSTLFSYVPDSILNH